MKSLLVIYFGCISLLLFAQAPPRNRVIGVIVQVDASGGVVKTDAGESVAFALQPETRIQRVAPGEKDLNKAETIQASAINAGDDISRELEALSSQSDVESELARLKAKSAPAAIESPVDGGDIIKAEPQTVEAPEEQS